MQTIDNVSPIQYWFRGAPYLKMSFGLAKGGGSEAPCIADVEEYARYVLYKLTSAAIKLSIEPLENNLIGTRHASYDAVAHCGHTPKPSA